MANSSTMLDLAHFLIAQNIARPEDIRGCSEEQIAEVTASSQGFPLPSDYLEFLKTMGRGAGRLFRGTSMFYPIPIECREYAREFAEDDDPGLELEGRFFFGHHQGYQFYFLQRGTAEVFMYTEQSGPPTFLSPDFNEFLWSTARSEATSRLDGYREA